MLRCSFYSPFSAIVVFKTPGFLAIPHCGTGGKRALTTTSWTADGAFSFAVTTATRTLVCVYFYTAAALVVLP